LDSYRDEPNKAITHQLERISWRWTCFDCEPPCAACPFYQLKGCAIDVIVASEQKKENFFTHDFNRLQKLPPETVPTGRILLRRLEGEGVLGTAQSAFKPKSAVARMLLEWDRKYSKLKHPPHWEVFRDEGHREHHVLVFPASYFQPKFVRTDNSGKKIGVKGKAALDVISMPEVKKLYKGVRRMFPFLKDADNDLLADHLEGRTYGELAKGRGTTADAIRGRLTRIYAKIRKEKAKNEEKATIKR
jgi:hypothetical protein